MRSREKNDEVVRLVFAGKITQKKGVKSLLRAMNLLDEESGQINLCLRVELEIRRV